jgi:3-deoxy-7-phosphoheptulonate synthase
VIIKLKAGISSQEIEDIKIKLVKAGIDCIFSNLYSIPVFLVYSPISELQIVEVLSTDGVSELVETPKNYMLASKAWKGKNTAFNVGGQCIGGKEINIIAGPCSVESEDQIFEVAEFLHSLGMKFIRGGAFKPRSSPYSFQGLGLEGLKLIRKAADAYGLSVVTEVIDSSLIGEVAEYADILQIGSRNMQNYYFLRQLGKINKPVLLKRGMYSRIDEWLMAAEYILSAGNGHVILCERGIRTFDTSVRNTMDISAIPLLKSLSHLPIYADPSHGTGRRDLISPMSMAAIAAGADGLMIEIHPQPQKALSDGIQSLHFEQFRELINKTSLVAAAVNRSLDAGSDSIAGSQKNIKLCVE